MIWLCKHKIWNQWIIDQWIWNASDIASSLQVHCKFIASKAFSTCQLVYWPIRLLFSFRQALHCVLKSRLCQPFEICINPINIYKKRLSLSFVLSFPATLPACWQRQLCATFLELGTSPRFFPRGSPSQKLCRTRLTRRQIPGELRLIVKHFKKDLNLKMNRFTSSVLQDELCCKLHYRRFIDDKTMANGQKHHFNKI